MSEIETPLELDGSVSEFQSHQSPAETSSEWDENEVENHQDLAPIGPGPIGTLIPAGVVLAMLTWSYWSELSWCWETWSSDPNYSHGFLVVPVSLWILLDRLRKPGRKVSSPWQLGWVILLGLLAIRTFFYERGLQWSSTVTLPLVLASLALTLGGWRFLRRSGPALAFLFFMLPLPTRANGILAQPLQSLATTASVAILKMTGLWVIAEGNVIYVGNQPITVAEACNGLSMMMTLAATVAAAVILLPVSAWVRVVLGLSVAPIALIANILRITATAWSVHWFGPEIGGRRAHDAAGWLMMPLALVLVLIEMKLLSWLVFEEIEETEPLLLGRPMPADQGLRQRLEVTISPPREDPEPTEGDLPNPLSPQVKPEEERGPDG